MPVGPTGKFYTFVGGSNLMVFKSLRHKNEAFRLIQYLSRDDVQRNYARIMGMPARLVPQRLGGRANANRAAFYEAIKHGRTYAPIAGGWGPVENAYKTHFGNILDIAAGQGRVRYSRTRRRQRASRGGAGGDSLLAQAR